VALAVLRWAVRSRLAPSQWFSVVIGTGSAASCGAVGCLRECHRYFEPLLITLIGISSEVG